MMIEFKFELLLIREIYRLVESGADLAAQRRETPEPLGRLLDDQKRRTNKLRVG
jgi:hypothetical protein